MNQSCIMISMNYLFVSVPVSDIFLCPTLQIREADNIWGDQRWDECSLKILFEQFPRRSSTGKLPLMFWKENCLSNERELGLPFSWWKFCWISFFFYFLPQDAMDLISGNYSVNRNSPSPFQLNGFESFSVRINALCFWIRCIKIFLLRLSSKIMQSKLLSCCQQNTFERKMIRQMYKAILFPSFLLPFLLGGWSHLHSLGENTSQPVCFVGI